MSREKIEEMRKEVAKAHRFFLEDDDYESLDDYIAERLYNAGYRKQNDEEFIDKIATYFEKEDNWTKLKYSWNACGKSVQLRDMLRDAICGASMKGGAE